MSGQFNEAKAGNQIFMSDLKIHIVKICVGATNVEDLWLSQERKLKNQPRSKITHITRMRPQRENELLKDGSIYWIFKGYILARQKIISLEKIRGIDGVMRCGIVLNPEIQLTQPVKRRPFQGWRYLKDEEAPKDLGEFVPGVAEIPGSLKIALSDLGIM